jgi:hypothetical protein
MEFMIITNDVKEAEKLLPQIPAYNFDLAKDYAILKNARYLLLSNSSFGYFPALCSETVKHIIAPKYWARHNVSNGYWASEQNIYSGFHYMDRQGQIFTALQCKQELAEYKTKSPLYRRLNQRPRGMALLTKRVKARFAHDRYNMQRLYRGVCRRIRRNARIGL